MTSTIWQTRFCSQRLCLDDLIDLGAAREFFLTVETEEISWWEEMPEFIFVGRISDRRRDWVSCGKTWSPAFTEWVLQATKVTYRKSRWHRWSEHEGMLKAERLQLSRRLLCITLAPRRDLGTAVGNSIALMRIDRHMKDSVSDWDMVALFYFHWTCHGIEQLYSSLKFSYLKTAQHKRRFRFSAGMDQHSIVD